MSNASLTGGGASSSTPAVDTYMFANIASDVSGYKQAVSLPSFVVGAIGDIATVVTTTPTLMGSFVTNLGFPNITIIPAGLISYHCDTEKVAGSNNYYVYAELYKRASGGGETLLATSDISSQTAANTVINQTVTGFIATNTSLLSTDRLVVKFYGVMLSSSATIHLYFDDATAARLTFPSPTVDATNFVPYTGATLNVDLAAKTIVAGNLSGTNTGDQTSIVGITGTMAEFNTAVTDGDILFNDAEGLGFRFENRTSDPGTPTVGQVWLRTDL